jgi:anti-sigma28 factor (negative regulator of flagellin synthesis)
MNTSSTSNIVRSGQTQEIHKIGAEREKPAAAQTPAPAPRSDQVQISDAGRALAAQAADQNGSQLSAERIAEVRERILSGAYNSLDVVEQVARKMVESGDI